MSEAGLPASEGVSLRLWPGVLLAGLTFFARYALPVVVPETSLFGYYAGVLGGVLVLVWWLFASRASRLDRWGGAALIVFALLLTPVFLHESVATFYGGTLFLTYAVPALSIAFVSTLASTRQLSSRSRRLLSAAAILAACSVWTLVRSPGTRADGGSDFEWRWSQTPEERLLASSDRATGTAVLAEVLEAEARWPGFRGPRRDGVVHGSRLASDWSSSPPVELWRRPVGPGWSSFAVRGSRLFTQEQRGDVEVVSCYDALSGEPLWTHTDAVRFWEAMGGAGPRATPSVSAGRVASLGATGILNVLDADSGALHWSRHVAEETGTSVPTWGVAGSPWIEGDLVLVAVANRLAAYDLETGDLRWSALDGSESYSSPQRMVIDGVPQVLLPGGGGLHSVAPASGELLWTYPWEGLHSLQPAIGPGGDLIVSAASNSSLSGLGLRRLAVSREGDGWQVREKWASRRLKPYFNDFVLHGGHAYGFDGRILASIDLETGERNWKGGRYGNGQLLLLADQDLLLVLSEEGEMVLVSATPESFSEIARAEALQGKTWNHPVLVDDLLWVRNDQEMAAYRLPLSAP